MFYFAYLIKRLAAYSFNEQTSSCGWYKITALKRSRTTNQSFVKEILVMIRGARAANLAGAHAEMRLGGLLPGLPGLTGIKVRCNWTRDVLTSHVEKQKLFV